MTKEVNILEHWPPVLHEIKEYLEIANAENPTLNALWQNIENEMNNRFIVTSDADGLSRREKALKMAVPSTDSIETRRFRLLARYQEQAPYTWTLLERLLDGLLGAGKYVLTRNVDEKWVRVEIELTVKGQFEAVDLMMERMTPQDMQLTVTLRYNQHILLAQYTHAQLASYTHQQLREDVIG